MRLCPKCGKIANYNDYFGAYICTNCDWKDYSPSKERLAVFRSSDCNFDREERCYECESEKKVLVV